MIGTNFFEKENKDFEYTLSEEQINLSSKLSSLDEDKFKIVLSLFKFILINLNKCKAGINILDQYLWQ